MTRSRILAFLVAIFATGAFAQVPPGEAPKVADEPLAIAVSVDSEEGVITGAFAFEVKIHNLTDRDYTLLDVSVRPPRALTHVRGLESELDCGSKDTRLSPRETVTCRRELAPIDMAEWSARLHPAALMFVPRDYPVQVTARYQGIVAGARERKAVETMRARFKPGLSAFVAGGILGALLLGLFVAVYEWRDVWIAERYAAFRPKRLGEMAVDTLSIFLGGSIVAVIAILLLQRVGDLNLPITVKVEDYLGGIVIGLFSGKIGEKLYRQMRTKNAGSEPPKEDETKEAAEPETSR